ncbi:STAS domain-containing protein [bacterium]|nr:STAS domain-containing protein [bacterium]
MINESGCFAHVVEVQGELDNSTSPELKGTIDGILAGCHTNLIVDLNSVRFIDSTGLGVLIGALKKIRESDRRLVLVCNVTQILSVFSITGLSKILTICKNLEEAEDALQK